MARTKFADLCSEVMAIGLDLTLDPCCGQAPERWARLVDTHGLLHMDGNVKPIWLSARRGDSGVGSPTGSSGADGQGNRSQVPLDAARRFCTECMMIGTPDDLEGKALRRPLDYWSVYLRSPRRVGFRWRVSEGKQWPCSSCPSLARRELVRRR